MLISRTTRRILALSLLSVIGCHRRGATPSAVASLPEPARAMRGPTDANIAAILLAANNTDISYARLAPSRAQSAEVKQFAERMLVDHTGVNRLVNDVITRIGLTPEDNTTSLDFRDESSAKRDILRELEGRAFDTTYIANEISYHTKLLAAIDNVLLPSVRSADLRQVLTSVRPAVAAHLTHAQQVRASLGLR